MNLFADNAGNKTIYSNIGCILDLGNRHFLNMDDVPLHLFRHLTTCRMHVQMALLYPATNGSWLEKLNVQTPNDGFGPMGFK